MRLSTFGRVGIGAARGRGVADRTVGTIRTHQAADPAVERQGKPVVHPAPQGQQFGAATVGNHHDDVTDGGGGGLRLRIRADFLRKERRREAKKKDCVFYSFHKHKIIIIFLIFALKKLPLPSFCKKG